MNLPLHILRKDCRRLRGWLAVWLALLVAQAALAIYGFTIIKISVLGRTPPHIRQMYHPSLALNSLDCLESAEFTQAARTYFIELDHGQDKMSFYDQFITYKIISGYAMTALWLAEIGLLAYLVISLIREDTPLGDRAFWRTRPLAGVEVLWGKTLFLLLVIVAVPALFQWLFTVFAGPSSYESSFALHHFITLQFGWIALAMLLAVLWENIFVGFLALGALAAFTVVFDDLLNPSPTDLPWTHNPFWMLYILGLEIALAAALWRRFFRRRTFLFAGIVLVLAWENMKGFVAPLFPAVQYPRVSSSPFWMLYLLIVSTGLAATIWMYLYRRRVVALGLLGVGVLLLHAVTWLHYLKVRADFYHALDSLVILYSTLLGTVALLALLRQKPVDPEPPNTDGSAVTS